MRPVHLKITAFGPFAGTEELWFDQLGPHPLFLINGPTGSGKTTILDAICYALYGKSTGDEREGPQMRSDLAPPDLLTEVILVFELGDKQYRIRRIPEQQRPKSRGEGFTLQQAFAELVEIDPEGNEQLKVDSKVTEATAEIESLTGLNADQFRQVMVIPQGKFRQLLMAESKEREQIFSNLFQTQIYKKLQDVLKVDASRIKKEVEEQQATIQGMLDSVEVENREQLHIELNALKPKCEAALKHKKTREAAYQQAYQQLQAAQALLDQFQHWEKARQKYTQLQQNKADIDSKRDRLDKAERAQQLMPYKKELDRCQSEWKSAVEELDQREKESRQAEEDLIQAKEQLKSVVTLEEERDKFKQELAQLDHYRKQLDKLLSVQKAGIEMAAAEQAAQEKLDAARGTLEQIQKQREEAEAFQSRLNQAVAQLPELQSRVKEWKERSQQRKELEAVRKEIQSTSEKRCAADQEIKQLADLLYQAENLLNEKEYRWHLGQASVLARKLKEGDPCPVCGSVEHPHPAPPEDDIPTEAELKRVREGKNRSQEQLTASRETHSKLSLMEETLNKAFEKTVKQLGEAAELSPEEVDLQYGKASAQLKELEEQKKQLDHTLKSLTALKSEEENCRKQIETAQQFLMEKKSLVLSNNAREDALVSELPEPYRKPEALQTEVSKVQAALKQKDEHILKIRNQYETCVGRTQSTSASQKAAAENRNRQEKALEKAKADWHRHLSESVFDSEVTVLSAQMKETDRNSLKKEINDYETALSQVQGELAHHESVLKDKSKPDETELKTALEKTSKEKEEAEQHWLILDKRLSHLEGAGKRLKHALAKQEQLDKKYRLVGTLSQVANGQTGHKISLQRFVLSVLLDDVLLEATHRLKTMSKGRYQLLRKEDRLKGNRASGLDLEVEDAYSGKVRSVATLSGGESFMAALAIALGLSDVVQAYAGGIRLDTLFIDEGFGSLDPESLDLAIRTLVDLQSSGRMIGIISHVSDLREQIPIRLDILATHKGSSIKHVSP